MTSMNTFTTSGSISKRMVMIYLMRWLAKENNLTEDLARELFKSAKESISEANSFDKAVLFWILNKCFIAG